MNLTNIMESVVVILLAALIVGAWVLNGEVKSNGAKITIIQTTVTAMAKRPMIMLMPVPKQFPQGTTKMINPRQFKELIVQPTLDEMVELWGPGVNHEGAVNLIMGTYFVESVIDGVTHIKQLGNGPALGVFQQEPSTERSIWDDYLAFRPDKASYVRGLMRQHLKPGADLVANLPYQVAMCRLKYWQRSFKWPEDHNNIKALGVIWKKEYNSTFGRGTVKKYVEHYNAAGDF